MSATTKCLFPQAVTDCLSSIIRQLVGQLYAAGPWECKGLGNALLPFFPRQPVEQLASVFVRKVH